MPAFSQDFIGRYQLLEQLGSGGMGAVYKAQDTRLKRVVALKVMHPALAHNQEFRDRFLQEAQSGARLKHPGIVQVHDVGEEGDYLFIVEDFIPGESLAARIKALKEEKRSMSLEETLELVRQVSLALAYAHQNGVLHRDIKPSNILLEPVAGEKLPYRPVLTDLGLAKLLVGGLETQTGTMMGTPAYMAPEQALGKPIDARCDVYALGVLLYELVAGRLPFPLNTVTQAALFHMHEPPPTPPLLPPGLPAGLESLLKQALQRDPADRPPSTEAFAEMLEQLLSQPEESHAEQAAEKEQKGEVQDAEAGEGEEETHLAGDAEQGRGASVWKKFQPPSEEQGFDRVEVFAPGGEVYCVRLGKDVMIIGREEGADIVLDDLKASRRHARLDYDGENYRLTDLNSTNGTFLGRSRLLPGMAETWSPEKPLRIGDHYLRLVLAETKPEVKRPAGEGTLVDLKVAAVSETGGRIGVAVPQTNLTVEAGGTATLSCKLINQGKLVDHFNLTVEGLPTGWVKEMPESVQLMPGQMQEVAFMIQPPRQPASRATRYPFILRVMTQSNPEEFVETRCAVTVLPYTQFNSQLQPLRLRSGKAGKVIVQNQGNSPQTFLVSFSDRADELVFTPSGRRIRLAEGKSEEVEFTVSLKQRHWVGGEKVHPFTTMVKAEGEEAAPQVHQGEVISRGRLPGWLVAILVPFCLVLALAVVVGIPLLRDADMDGLATYEELRYGTNPEGSDSDGDRLPDGTEVKSLGTDPLRRDTDGDELDDFSEVSGCTSPLLADTDGDGVNDGADAEPCQANGVLPAPTQVQPGKPIQPPGELIPVSISLATRVEEKEVRTVCPYRIQFTGALTSDAPATLVYRWERGDGSKSEAQRLDFERAGTQLVFDEVVADKSGGYSDRLVVLEPKELKGELVTIRLTCLPQTATSFQLQLSVSPTAYQGVCPAVFQFTGTITANGAAQVHYNFLKSNATYTEEAILNFDKAGTQEVSYRWEITSPGIHGLKLHVISPLESFSDEVVFKLECTRAPITAENAAQVEYSRNLYGFTQPVTGMAFDPGGRFLVTVTAEELRFWSIPDGGMKFQYQLLGENISGVALSLDGAYLALSSANGFIEVARVSDPLYADFIQYASTPNGESLEGVAFAPESYIAAAFSKSGRVFFWDVRRNNWVKTLAGDPIRGILTSLAFSKSGQWLAAGAFAEALTGQGRGYDDDVYIWRVDGYAFERTLAEPRCSWVKKVAFSPTEEDLLAVGNTSDGEVRLWRVTDGQVVRQMHIGDEGRALAFSPDGSVLAANSGSYVLLWRVLDGELLATLYAHHDAILDLAFSPDGAYLASASKDQSVVLWSVGGK